MEPPYKRQRLSPGSVPDPDLQKRRARNDHRLKSIFELIFDKYGKDFDGVGDEIDLRTGEIVVNNGHVLGMTDEKDVGQLGDPYEDGESETSSEGEGGDRQDFNEEAVTPFPEPDIDLSHGHGMEDGSQNTANPPLASQSLSTMFGRSLHQQTIDYESEEDELADSTIEWVTPREARAISHQKWQLPSDGPAFIDEPNIEEAWRAPPLPGDRPLGLGMPNMRPVTKSNESTISLKASIGTKPKRLGVAGSLGSQKSGDTRDSDEHSMNQQDPQSSGDTCWDHPTNAFISEMSSLVQEPVDGYLRPLSQTMEASARSGHCNAVPQTLNREFPPVLTHGQHLLDELQRGFGAQHCRDSFDGGIGLENAIDAEGDAPVRRKTCIDRLSKHVHVVTSPPLGDDAANRKKTCIDLSKKQAHIVSSSICPMLLPESKEQIIQQEPESHIKDNLSANALVSDVSAPKDTNPANAEQAKDANAPAVTTTEGDLNTAVSAKPTPKVTSSLPRSGQVERTEKPNGVLSAPRIGQSIVVQVLLPPVTPYKPDERNITMSNVVIEADLPSSLETRQEVVQQNLNECDRDSSPSYKASANYEATLDVEIPDSQPDFSSSMIVNNDNASLEIPNPGSPRELSQSGSPSETQHENRTAVRNHIHDSEFDDELSVMTIRPKLHFAKSVTPAVPLSMRAAPTKLLSYQARKMRNNKAIKPAIGESFSSLPSDVLDSSEDELAAMR